VQEATTDAGLVGEWWSGAGPHAPMPLPPSALGEVAVKWLISPEGAGCELMPGDELAELAHGSEGRNA
jgi:hypothetical protein